MDGKELNELLTSKPILTLGDEDRAVRYKSRLDELNEAVYAHEAAIREGIMDAPIASNLRTAMLSVHEFLRGEEDAPDILLPADVNLLVAASRSYYANLPTKETKAAATAKKKKDAPPKETKAGKTRASKAKAEKAEAARLANLLGI